MLLLAHTLLNIAFYLLVIGPAAKTVRRFAAKRSSLGRCQLVGVWHSRESDGLGVRTLFLLTLFLFYLPRVYL